MLQAGDEVFYYGNNLRLYGRKMVVVSEAGRGYAKVRLEDEEDEFIVRTYSLQAARQMFDQKGRRCRDEQGERFM